MQTIKSDVLKRLCTETFSVPSWATLSAMKEIKFIKSFRWDFKASQWLHDSLSMAEKEIELHFHLLSVGVRVQK